MKQFFLVLFFFVAIEGSAQTSLEAFLTPGIGYRQLSAKPLVSPEFKDSLNKMDMTRKNWSFGLNYIHAVNRNINLQLGLEYHRMSFTRVLEDLQFHDTVHPQVGRIEDLSQTGQKDAFFYHKYHYLSVPFVVQTFLAPKYGRKKASVHLITGISFDLLIQDKIDVFLKGYTVKGESRHTIQNDYTAAQLNINTIIGGRFVFFLEEKLAFTVQPHLTFPLLVSTEDDFVAMRLFQTNLRVGIAKTL